MSPSALALLVIVWPGQQITPQAIDRAECDRAVEAVKTAVHIRDEQYAMQSDVSAYCIPLDTAANQAIYALLEPPAPSPKTAPIHVQSPDH